NGASDRETAWTGACSGSARLSHPSLFALVPIASVRPVEVVVPDRIVTVPVLVGLGIDRCAVVMPMMLIMTMDVGMPDGFVTMPVALRFTDESPHTEADA